MNRRELVDAVSQHTGADKRMVGDVVQGLQDVITATVAKGEQVAISGFAKFVKVERPARMGRNPATGEAIKIKASKKARITPLKGFKDAVLSGKGPKLNGGGPAKAAPKKAPAKKATAKKATAKKAARRR